jgi:hypothetical protein
MCAFLIASILSLATVASEASGLLWSCPCLALWARLGLGKQLTTARVASCSVVATSGSLHQQLLPAGHQQGGLLPKVADWGCCYCLLPCLALPCLALPCLALLR